MACHRLESPTIVFMPHCDLHLYDNFFRENWCKEQLSRVVLIANRLSEYAERYVQPFAARPSPRLSRSDPVPAAAFPAHFPHTPWHVPSLPFTLSASFVVLPADPLPLPSFTASRRGSSLWSTLASRVSVRALAPLLVSASYLTPITHRSRIDRVRRPPVAPRASYPRSRSVSS